MSGLVGNPFLLTSAGGATGYQIERSLRFNSSDSAFCGRSFASAGNRTTWSLSFWYKRSTLGTNQCLFVASDFATTTTTAYVTSSDTIEFYDYQSSAYSTRLVTAQVFRDTSAWYHLVFVWDTNNGTSADRARIYVNGSRVSTFTTSTYPSSGTQSRWNNNVAHEIGKENTSNYLNGYLADVHFIDGQALTPSSFTEVSATTGQLIPKAYSGTYGTNGFHLPFSDNSTAAALGTDTSGNSNTWTVNNISVGFPVTQNYSTTTTGTAPTPYLSTSYYALAFDGDTSTSFSWTTGTWAMDWTSLPSAVTVSSSLRVFCYPRLGTLTVNINGSNVASITGNSVDWRTISFTGTINTISFTGTDTYAGVYAIEVDGAILIDPRANSVNDSLVDTPTSYGTDTGAGGEVRGNYCTWNPLKKGAAITNLTNGNLDWVSTTVGSNYTSMVLGTIGVSSGKWYWENTVGSSFYVGVGIATDQVNLNTYPGGDAKSWSYLYNGVTYNNGSVASYGASFTTGDVIGVALNLDAGTLTFYKNGVSQGVAYSGLSGPTYFPMSGDPNSSTDGALVVNFGQRPFAYTAPTGFKALCDTNLPAPVVAQPSTVMDVKLWTGNGSTQTISGLGFSPDLVWLKGRSLVSNHRLYDQIRGATKSIYSDLTDAEGTESTGLTAFTSDGFSLGSQAGHNQNASTYVGWCWDAGSSTVTNTQGSITSQVRANASAGFSIVTFTAQSSGNATIGHGLGVEPHFIIVKSRAQTYSWLVYHKNLTSNAYYLILNSTAAQDNTSNAWNSTTPTSTVFTLGSTYAGGGNSVAYCFAPVAGYSAFGSYTGNGSADGVFQWCGFRPRWILLKSTGANGASWTIFDTARSTYNQTDAYLFANASSAEGNAFPIDILSNGFKLRTSDGLLNSSSYTYVWAAFAESPFQYARAR